MLLVVSVQTPDALLVVVPNEVLPSKISTTLPASAVPSIVGRAEKIVPSSVVMTGAKGDEISIVSEIGAEDEDIFPAASVALAVTT